MLSRKDNRGVAKQLICSKFMDQRFEQLNAIATSAIKPS